jgi:LacI family transcriptional regulator
MKSSMRDVAKHADVSVATVSHVINSTRFVTEETRLRVLASIQKLEYFPDQMGRIFKTGKKNLIGIIVPDISNPFWAFVIEEVENVLSARGSKLVIVNTKENESREIENIRLLASGIVDGLIIATTLSDFDLIKKLIPDNFPMVYIDRIIPNCPCDTIVTSDYNALYEGVERLILNGHQRIGYITGLMRLSTSQDRLSAYKAAMADYKLPIEDSFIQVGDSMAKSSLLLLQSLLEARCTALVVSNNVMANDVLFYLNEREIKIGRDINLLGYSEDSRRDYNMRRMDLVVQPSAEIGRKAGKQILERIFNPSLPIRNVVLYSTLLKKTQ